jgi:hypothetical protein
VKTEDAATGGEPEAKAEAPAGEKKLSVVEQLRQRAAAKAAEAE